MAEETPAVDGAAQAAAGTDGSQHADGQAPAGGEETISLDEARKLRREAQGLRKRLAELETADNKRKQAELSELELAQARLKELETQISTAAKAHQDQVLRYEVMLKASAMNVVDPEAVVRLLDVSSLEFDDDGRPTNVEKALKDLLKAKSYLVKLPDPSGAAPNTNARAGNDTTKDAKAKEEELRRRFKL